MLELDTARSQIRGRTGRIESSSEPPSEGLAAWSREEDM
jgi:hypothetical protein